MCDLSGRVRDCNDLSLYAWYSNASAWGSVDLLPQPESDSMTQHENLRTSMGLGNAACYAVHHPADITAMCTAYISPHAYAANDT